MLYVTQEKINTEEVIVLFVDECHLHWGDVCGYVWGKTDSRVEVAISNEKQRQTYYGALNYKTGKVIIKAYEQGNSENTIDFVQYLHSSIFIVQNFVNLGWSKLSS